MNAFDRMLAAKANFAASNLDGVEVAAAAAA